MGQACLRLATVLFFSLVVLGCEPPKPVASGAGGPPLPPAPPGSAPAPPPEAAPAPPASETSAQPALPPETKFGVFAGGIDDLAARPAAPAAPATPAADPGTERVKAEKGVGIKGRSLDQYEGLLVTPAKAFFSAKERIAFEIQIPHALNLYKASEGQGPKSHEEFMEKIVQFNQIKLPQLPPDAKYVYDVQTETLMVERPRKQ